MKCIEIVSVRTSGNHEQQAYMHMKTFCREVKEPLLSGANLYINASFPGDLAVILEWQGTSTTNDKTSVGLRMANALKRFGLVDHVFWIVIEG
ncbi:MAG: hypothetical protein ABFD82_06110 [Syntrophaceae bacterium]